jgi:glycosyltransferase involved in cell wall biosynthesis
MNRHAQRKADRPGATPPGAAAPATARPAAFAIPGDIETKTGGYIYERTLLHSLRAAGRRVDHLILPASFPDPSPADMAEAIATMAAVPPDCPLIIDGLVFGSVDPAGLATVRAPIVAMIHHPLALEIGLSPDRAARLYRTEADNIALAARIVVPSRHTAEILTGRYGADPARILIAPPGFRPADPVRLPASPPLILSVGILHPRKGHDILLAALSRLTDLDWQAVIVGAPLWPQTAVELQALATTLGLEDRVHFTGLIEEQALIDHYRRATVFALATRYEGYGIVFGEALLHGLPIVSCRVGAVPQTIPEGAGVLVPPDDPAAFAASLRHLLTDAPTRARLAAVSQSAGQALPTAAETASVMARALDLAAQDCGFVSAV